MIEYIEYQLLRECAPTRVRRIWVGGKLIWSAEHERAPGVKPAIIGLAETAPDMRYRGLGFCDNQEGSQ